MLLCRNLRDVRHVACKSPVQTTCDSPGVPLSAKRMFGGPQFAKRTALVGALTRGGLGKPLGRSEVALSSRRPLLTRPTRPFLQSSSHVRENPCSIFTRHSVLFVLPVLFDLCLPSPRQKTTRDFARIFLGIP